MSEVDVEKAFARLRGGLAEAAARGVHVFPIRHHSPACALHLRRLIESVRPRAVLVEGPEDLTPLVPLLLHEEARAPFAVYTTFVDRKGRLGKRPAVRAGEPARFGANYPFCTHSPELVALRAGSAVGAEVRFVDLSYPHQVLAERAAAGEGAPPRIVSLLSESRLSRSAWLAAVARQCGCRNSDELWDHLFEVPALRVTTADFIRDVAAFCFAARISTAPEEIDADGTRAREKAMAAAVRTAAAAGGPVLLVTGGFHVGGILDLLEEDLGSSEFPEIPPAEAQTVLMRYSYDQLDALNGYGAGLPSPRYYEIWWQFMEEGREDPGLAAASELVIELGAVSREKALPFQVSIPDEIAALEGARLLARLRGHASPSREDLLDGIRGAFVKGSLDAEGALVVGVVHALLAGDRVGSIPDGAGVPPLVRDFRKTAERLNLSIADSTQKRLPLDIYKSAAHRTLSRFFHALLFLKAPFGVLVAGPDFARGVGLDRMQEVWEYAWSPAAESALIEASVYGASVPEAAAARLAQVSRELADSGQGRSASPAVQLLVRALQMGLHESTSALLDRIEENVAEDPSFPSLADGLVQLALLWQSREPLEAHAIPRVPALAAAAYRRACFLAGDLAATQSGEIDAVLEGMSSVREALSWGGELFDRELLLAALRRLLASPRGNSAVLGAACGLLFAEGDLDETALASHAAGFLGAAAVDRQKGTAFLRGLFGACRETAWRVPALLRSLDALIASWDENEYLLALPDLRLAFSSLTPREADRVAELVASLHGKAGLGDIVVTGTTEKEVAGNAALTRAVLESLRLDGLQAWGEGPG